MVALLLVYDVCRELCNSMNKLDLSTITSGWIRIIRFDVKMPMQNIFKRRYSNFFFGVYFKMVVVGEVESDVSFACLIRRNAWNSNVLWFELLQRNVWSLRDFAKGDNKLFKRLYEIHFQKFLTIEYQVERRFGTLDNRRNKMCACAPMQKLRNCFISAGSDLT